MTCYTKIIILFIRRKAFILLWLSLLRNSYRWMKVELRHLTFVRQELDEGNVCPACPKISLWLHSHNLIAVSDKDERRVRGWDRDSHPFCHVAHNIQSYSTRQQRVTFCFSQTLLLNWGLGLCIEWWGVYLGSRVGYTQVLGSFPLLIWTRIINGAQLAFLYTCTLHS